ncbi:MAG: phage tail assembly chaperone [Gammaproteobacteria bacterium]
MKKEDFYTKPKADAGVKMPLTLSDGTDSGHWLMVRGTDSDAFRKARFHGARAIRDLPEKMDEWDRAKGMDSVILDNLVSLVAGWSFEEPFTEEAVREFLTSAPHIADAVDRAASERSRFFGIASES